MALKLPFRFSGTRDSVAEPNHLPAFFRNREKSHIGPAIILAGAVFGYITALQALGHAGTGPAPGNRDWTQGIVNDKDAYTVYALAHFRNDGFLPPPRSSFYFTRFKDDAGDNLRGNCTYELSGNEPQARWWSVSAGAVGAPTSANAFTAGDAVLQSDGTFVLALSHKPVPGNWLVTPDVGTMQVSIVLNEPNTQAKGFKLALPRLKRLGCE